MSKKKEFKIFTNIADVDVSENDIKEYDTEHGSAILDKLLVDHTRSHYARKKRYEELRAELGRELTLDELKKDIYPIRVNISWATGDYADRGDGYKFEKQIKSEDITGQENGRVIMPRVLKDSALQVARSKDKAEVFTPSWMCNAQNNLIDREWFGYDAFNTEFVNENGEHDWKPTDMVVFPEGDPNKTWQKYVAEDRLEITCGEAPYLVSRYDTTTGNSIELAKRIGLLDRKLRVVTENCHTQTEWTKWAKIAFRHTYGYEWQGDNLLLAREALLYTFIQYYIEAAAKYGFKNKMPLTKSIDAIARVISWNIWQMDGLLFGLPNCEPKERDKTEEFNKKKPASQGPSLFADEELDKDVEERLSKEIDQYNDALAPNEHFCLIRDWSLEKAPKGYQPKPWEDSISQPWQKLTFYSLLHQSETNNNENKKP